MLSTYATVAAAPLQYSGLNKFVYQATPYVLILLPICYLFGVIAVLLLKRLYTWAKATCPCSPRSDNARPTQTEVSMDYAADHDSVTSEVRSEVRSDFTDSVFIDMGEREPLLMNNVASEGGGAQESHYRPKAYSHTSVHVHPASTELKEHSHD